MNGTLLKSAVRTGTTSSEDVVTGVGQRGVLLVLDITAAPEKEDTLTLSVEAKDPASGAYVPLTAFATSKKGSELGDGAVLAFTVYPGALETAAVDGHEVQGLGLPRKWRVTVTHETEEEAEEAQEWTYSVGASPLA